MEGENETIASKSIFSLPNEVLAHLFKFCSVQDLGRLSVTCKAFKTIIDDNSIWKHISKNVTISNQVSLQMKQRCVYELSERDKVKISSLWFRGTPDRCSRVIIRFHQRFMPQLEVEASFLWFTKGNSLIWRHRAPDGHVTHLGGRLDAHDDDITKFVLLPNHVVTGGRDNQIFIFSRDSKEQIHRIQSAHFTEVNCLDCNNEILVSVGRNAEIKVYGNFPHPELRNSYFHGDHIWAASIMANRQILIGSAARSPETHPLQLVDIERNTTICKLGDYIRPGAGISCICPESNNEVYTGSYDTSVRLWDVRTPAACVRLWEDPFDSSIVSLSSDYHNTIFAGTQRHGVVCIYDKRGNDNMKFFYMGAQNSPVYSITFDALNLFAALDRGIYLHTCGFY